MKKLWVGLFLWLGSIGVAYGLPDVVISSLTQQTPQLLSDGRVSVRFSFRIRNQGTNAASRFKVSAEAKGGPSALNQYFTMPLLVVWGGVADSGWYLWTESSLNAGGNFAFVSRVIFPSSWRRHTVRLRLLGDSCAGDEFLAAYCRVRESIEGNNYSPEVSFILP